jgi:CDP-2,3-bis-(O-geranylgeranyl)-sn-glycerol synthase
MSEETPPITPQIEKKKFFRGPRPLNPDEKRTAKMAFGLAIFGVCGFLLQLIYFVFTYSIDDWLTILVYWIVFIMPAYLADAGMLVMGGGKPVDLGYICKDGRRLFGEGKSWRGLFLGPLLFAVPIALAIHGIIYWQWDAIMSAVDNFLASPSVNYNFYEGREDQLKYDLALYLLGDANGTNDLATFWKLVPRVVLCAQGASVGDLVKSWLKRRTNKVRGEPLWFFDQNDFVIGAIIFAGAFVFTFSNPVIELNVFIMLMIITPTITVVANTISYFSGHKSVPW